MRKEEIEKRVELLISLDNCGVTIDDLLAILNNGIIRNEEKVQENEESRKVENSMVNLAESSIPVVVSARVNVETTSAYRPVEIRMAEIEEINSEEEIYCQAKDCCNTSKMNAIYQTKFSNDSNPKPELFNLDQWKMSDFRLLSQDRNSVSLLSIRQCSFFVAALMSLFDDDLEDESRNSNLYYSIFIGLG